MATDPVVSGGYGDQMSWEQMEEIIASKERLIAIQAAERRPNPNDWEDLLNEARITIWRVLTKRSDAPPAYLHASTGKRLTEVVSRGVWFGMEGHRGREIDPIRRNDRDSFDDPDLFFEVAAPDVLRGVEMAYHEGEIIEALVALTSVQRQYVVLRFWGGYTNPEIARIRGLSTTEIERQWRVNIRPVLKESLGHLVGVL